MILKQVIRYHNDPDTVEATWVVREQLPDISVPESVGSTTLDEDGNEVPGVVSPARVIPGGFVEIEVRSHAYHVTQFGQLRADLGADAPQYEALLSQVEAEYVPPPPPPPPTQFELDQGRYTKRAPAKEHLIPYMAADNMSRVRSGVWTVPQLMSLMDDPAVAAANAYMATLSFELAAQSIASAATQLLTPEIRADWVAKLQAHFYLGG